MKPTSRPFYFTRLELENIRSFGDSQCLDLLNEEKRPAQWTLILGDNGVGKTTLLQCLARMRPSYNPVDPKMPDAMPIEPELNQEEDNDVLKAFTRSGTDQPSRLRAHFVAGATFEGSRKQGIRLIETSIEILRSKGHIQEINAGGSFKGKAIEPLILAYGAGRHMGTGNLDRSMAVGPTDSLFDPLVELIDAEEALYQLDYARLKKRKFASVKLNGLKALLAAILPEVANANDIDIRGPRLPGAKEEEGGVWVKTRFGIVPLTRLSLGYQTVMAWTTDIAWRMINHYVDISNPLSEPAIILVDEIDLHLHPQWQRNIRMHLTKHFPAVQFICTAHSPLMAQDALETNLAVVQHEVAEATILSDPAIVKGWRLDQIITSELFGLPTARPPRLDEQLRRRIELGQRKELTAAESAEFAKLDAIVHQLPTAELAEDQSAMEIIRRAALILEQTNKA
jgi:energy-coupling factor transporter ATP-binding protein EcfA2